MAAKTFICCRCKNGKGRLPVIWFQAQACSGCAVSFLDTEYPSVDDVLIEVISLEFNPVVMGATGDLAMGVIDRMMVEEKGKYIFVVEGSIPLEADGLYCTVGEKEGNPVTALGLGKKHCCKLNGSCSSR